MLVWMSLKRLKLNSGFSMYPLDGPESLVGPQGKNHYDSLCVSFSHDGAAMFAKFDGSSSIPQPLNVGPIFHEFAGTWHRGKQLVLSPGGWSVWFTERSANISCCTWLNKKAFMVPVVVLGNLWHTLWHTIPAYKQFTRLALPHGNHSRLEVLALPVQPISKYNTLNSVGWQLFLGSIGFSDQESSDQILSQTRLLKQANHFFCFPDAYVVGHDKFSLAQENDALHPSIDAFRLAVHREFRRQFPHQLCESSNKVYFMLRRMHGRRVLNEHYLTASLKNLSFVGMVVFEYLPFHQQLTHVLSSVGLCGIHGAGLAWGVLLKSGFLLEIVPSNYTAPTRVVYSILAQVSHLVYESISAPCMNANCDVIVNVTHVASVIQQMYFSTPPPRGSSAC